MRASVRGAWLIGILLMGLAGMVWAGEPRVQALFPGKAMFSLAGEQFVLSDGETGPGGLRLLRATSQSALVEYDGRQQEWSLERGRFAGDYTAAARPEMRIMPGPEGGYGVSGLINGRSVRFVVDTGATAITLSETEAMRLGLPVTGGVEVPVETASGRVVGRRILIDRVQVGGLDEPRVDAVILPGDRPATALLGMSFLSRLNIRSEGPMLVLQAR
jgi:aspartyl protease family protein